MQMLRMVGRTRLGGVLSCCLLLWSLGVGCDYGRGAAGTGSGGDGDGPGDGDLGDGDVGDGDGDVGDGDGPGDGDVGDGDGDVGDGDAPGDGDLGDGDGDGDDGDTPTCQWSLPVPVERGQVGGAGGSLTVEGDLAYVGVGPRLTIWRLTDAGLSIVGETPPLDGIVRALSVVAGHVCTGVTVFDLSKPRTPRIVDELGTAARVRHLALAPQRVIAAAWWGGLYQWAR